MDNIVYVYVSGVETYNYEYSLTPSMPEIWYAMFLFRPYHIFATACLQVKKTIPMYEINFTQTS